MHEGINRIKEPICCKFGCIHYPFGIMVYQSNVGNCKMADWIIH